MAPGCQADCTLIAQGPQGIGKTSAFRALVPVPTWYADTSVTIGDKDSYQNLHGVWLYGLDELDSVTRGERTKTKNFLTQTRDKYRPSYGHAARSFARQNVFCGTTNEETPFTDRTGNRRFWPTRVLRPINVAGIARDRDQLWAEALHRYARSAPWHVDTPELRALCEAEQAERLQADPWESMVAAWLDDPTETIEDVEEGIGGAPRRVKRKVPFDTSRGVTTAEVLVHALEMRKADVTRGDEMRAAEVLRGLDYEPGPRRSEKGAIVRRYTATAGQPGQAAPSNGCPEDEP
jgi:predicted P-loop ATPase